MNASHIREEVECCGTGNRRQLVDKKKFSWGTVLILLLLAGIFSGVVFAAVHLAQKNTGSISEDKSSCSSSCNESECPFIPVPKTSLLPVPDTLEERVQPWYIYQDIEKQPITLGTENGSRFFEVQYQMGLYVSFSKFYSVFHFVD